MCKTPPMPAPMPDYVVHCQELFAPLGPVRVKRMFGGFGVYVDEVFIALVADEQLYLKADDETRARFEAAGCTPFTYEAAGKRTALGYWSAPDDAMESSALMMPWARLAIAAALRSRAKKPAARKTAAKKTAVSRRSPPR